MTIPRAMANAAASRISLEYGLVGPTYTISTACSSSNHAIGQAYWMVRNGGAEVAITGGSEDVFALGVLLAWGAMRLVRATTATAALELPTTRVKHGRVTLTVACRGELQGGNSEMLAAPMAVIVDRTVDPKAVVDMGNFGGGSGAQ